MFAFIFHWYFTDLFILRDFQPYDEVLKTDAAFWLKHERDNSKIHFTCKRKIVITRI